MDEMELDHNHSCPLHGERWVAVFFVVFLLQTVTAARRVDTIKVPALQHVLKAPHVCFPGLFCLLSCEIQALDL